jgi:hypothetical protein
MRRTSQLVTKGTSPTPRMRRLRRLILVMFISAGAAASTKGAIPVSADAPVRIGNAVCSLGDQTLPSIFELRFGATHIADPSAAHFLSTIHPGSTCSWTVTTVAAMPTSAPSGSPPDWGLSDGGLYYGTPNYALHNCGAYPTVQVGGWWCRTQFNQVVGSFGLFSDGFYYDSGQAIETREDPYAPATEWTWSNVGLNYSNSDGQAVSSGIYYDKGNSASPGWSYSAANGLGQHDKDKGICWVPGGQITCLFALLGYTIHVGQIGTPSSPHWPPQQPSCSLADFKPYENQVTFSTGNCTSP